MRIEGSAPTPARHIPQARGNRSLTGPFHGPIGDTACPRCVISITPRCASWLATARTCGISMRHSSADTARAASEGQAVAVSPRCPVISSTAASISASEGVRTANTPSNYRVWHLRHRRFHAAAVVAQPRGIQIHRKTARHVLDRHGDSRFQGVGAVADHDDFSFATHGWLGADERGLGATRG